MQLKENVSLKPYNTFGVEARAKYFANFTNVQELEELLHSNPGLQPFILGGGSNILFTQDYNGLVLKNEISGISELHEDNEYVYIKAGAGESWHQFVLHCISRNWAGIENLSLIPGNVGASPMQNIGAYGVEIENVFWDLEALHIKERSVVTFTKNDCDFGYRESVFKRKYKGQFVILNATFRLRKKPHYNISYGAIEQQLALMKVKELSLKAVSDAVIAIRSSKLPDPVITGNAGSFFKNPSVSKTRFEELEKHFPGIVGYNNADGTKKLAAGWLIENSGPKNGTSGWKGYRVGDAGCHEKQALVLVNYGSATGQEILQLSEAIQQSVNEKFGVMLEREVNIF
ncbi:MAG TPA: UDP-N-acetylmuramate dehydrogenase [Chitinophagaceae bacterium]|nr:UDP-N-acetylmuramate dehydrogenase [Chitinophagaceae bacterium]MCB9055934.1 UDP-N-acetylmuramate dehydrogenase [Chitinophagales bacterium]HPG10430.1 UDP-N-acetylmuramate dehydrogenase [Chitinophagaceae bacterium]HRX95074.1 UDP-N-acetylmuramate dehydrogenase [Chitinophagaceae bacterium]